MLNMVNQDTPPQLDRDIEVVGNLWTKYGHQLSSGGNAILLAGLWLLGQQVNDVTKRLDALSTRLDAHVSARVLSVKTNRTDVVLDTLPASKHE
jgi:hypothetical protein